MELKLKSGRKLKVKELSLDERDSLLDSVQYDYDDKGNIKSVTMMNTTITKWIRTCIDGDVSDKALMGYTLEERTEIFTKFQSIFILGEEKASK